MTLPLPPELPLLPAPRERAMLVLMNPDASLESYLAVIEGDPALTASVLRAANSAMSWPVRTILDAGEGVVRLGTSAVRHLITATVVRSQFASVESAGIDADELWRHLLGCALLCEAQARDEAAKRQAFTAGILHDLGRLAMAAQAPTRYREVVDAAQHGISTRVSERQLFGTTHDEFGRRICSRWRLPEEIAEAVGAHHDHDQGTGHDATEADRSADAGAKIEADPDDLGQQLALARWILAGMGVGDGVHRPESRRPEAEEHPLVERLGGRMELMSSIRWFRDSTQGRRRLPSRRRP